MSPESTTRGAVPPGARPYQPTHDEIESLITRARNHSFGLEFLEFGALDAVSAIFGAHAFVVDAAREHLARSRPRSDS